MDGGGEAGVEHEPEPGVGVWEEDCEGGDVVGGAGESKLLSSRLPVVAPETRSYPMAATIVARRDSPAVRVADQTSV